MEKKLFVLKSIRYFWICLVADLFFGYLFFSDSDFFTGVNVIKDVLGIGVFLATTYTFFGLGTIIEIYSDKVTVKKFFGLVSTKEYYMTDLLEINHHPKYSSKLPKFSLKFKKGVVYIYEFQTGFSRAKIFIEDNYSEILV